ncbi:MAG: hypothetical protein MUF51_00505, partial [Vicinamibacteria bacterium]|nr:hypothetical protein [Vicinamibacteria bacterium]
MNPLHTVVLLSRDPALEVMLAGALSARAMRLLVFKGALEKLGALQDEQPHLILLDWMGLADEAERWIRETRRLAFGLRVPLVALASNADATNAALSAGADDFLLLPRDLEHLGVRLTACLRLVERVTQSGLTGAVRAGSPIRLLKLCEDHRLTGRLSIATADGKRFVDFLGGEVVEARVEPPVEGQEALDVFLAAQ